MIVNNLIQNVQLNHGIYTTEIRFCKKCGKDFSFNNTIRGIEIEQEKERRLCCKRKGDMSLCWDCDELEDCDDLDTGYSNIKGDLPFSCDYTGYSKNSKNGKKRNKPCGCGSSKKYKNCCYK